MTALCVYLAHASNVEERNAQFRQICHSLMSKKNPYARPSHITVWLGDLNYRIQGIDTLPARSLIQRNHLKVKLRKAILHLSISLSFLCSFDHQCILKI